LRISLYDNNLSYPYCTTTEAFFDDFRVQRLQAQVFQENHYDAFGLNLKGIEENDLQTQQNVSENRLQYNGKEKTEDFSLMWNDHGARNLDLQIGRWWGVDALAHKYWESSTYTAMGNNPISFIDPDGMDIINADKERLEQAANDLQKSAEKFNTISAKLTENGIIGRDKKSFGADKTSWKEYKSAEKNLKKANNNFSEKQAAFQQTERAINDLQTVDNKLFNDMNCLSYNGQQIDIYVTSGESLDRNQREAQTLVAYFENDDKIGHKRGEATFIANAVKVRLELGTKQPDTKLAHEFGHIFTFITDPLRYSREATSGINCQDYNNRQMYQVKDAFQFQKSYSQKRETFFK
jgi:RHS repeat-associated protein